MSDVTADIDTSIAYIDLAVEMLGGKHYQVCLLLQEAADKLTAAKSTYKIQKEFIEEMKK